MPTKRAIKPKYRRKSDGSCLYVQDCIRVMNQLDDTFTLVFADPPFNIGHEYPEYNDKRNWDEYESWTYGWLGAATKLLDPEQGSIFIHCPDEIVDIVSYYLRFYTPLYRVNWIIRVDQFGQYNESKFIRCKQHLLWFAHENRVFNVDQVLEPSNRLLAGDKRVKESKFGGYRPYSDVWQGPNLGRIQGNNVERVPSVPNQLPEKYVARIIRAASNEGDTVFDPFVGSGTTPTVAMGLGRRFVGCEIGSRTAEKAWERALIGPKRDVTQ